jgi:hypothetical protein
MADDFSAFPEVKRGAQTMTDGEFNDFPEVSVPARQTTIGAQASAAAEAAGRGALESSGFLGGAMLGATAGSVAGPPGAFIGGLAGAVGGYMAGEMAGESLGLRSPEQMPPELRPGGYFGQSLGGAVTMGAAPFAAAASGYRFGDSMVGRFLNQIINTAKTRPVVTAVAEASSAASAATGAGVAEIIAPGRADIRVNAELAAGVLNPTRLAIDGLKYASNVSRRALQSISPSARETAAAKTLSDILRVTGEDPATIAKVLRQQGIIPADMTAAQKSGSMALGALEQHLAKIDKQFGAEAAQKSRDALDAIRGQITLLTGTGDPEAVAAAAALRALYFRTILSNEVKMATDDVLRKTGGITKDTPAVRDKLSVAVRDALEKTLEDARKVEGDLWSRVDGTRPAEVSNLQQTYDEIVQDTLPELRGKKMPTVVRQFIERVTSPREGQFDYDPETLAVRPIEAAPPGTNVDEMRKLRSELLAMSRAAARDPDQVGMERIYSQLAEAVLDDIDTAFRGSGDTAYDEARLFSREMNDTFTRSFAGRVVAEGKYGDRVAPEILLRKALASGKEAGAFQLRELEEATRFLSQRGFSDDSAYRTAMDAQERFLRLAAADAIDPLTGRASPERISKFVRDNATLMNRFPEVKADLMATIKSEQRLKTLTNRAKNVEDILARQGVFASLLGASGDNAVARANVAKRAAERVLVSANQEAELTNLINIAKGGGTGRGGRITIKPEEAIDGLRASIFNAVLDKSRNPRDGVLNIEQARGLLFTPNTVGRKSLIQVMQDQGVIKPDEVKSIRQFFDAADNISRSRQPGTAVDIKQNILDVATATISRMIGSGIAGGAARGVGSATPSLIVHGAGARLAEEAMTKVPMASVNKVLTEAMNDPEKMALLLMKADTPEKAAAQARRLNAWFVQSGLTAATDLGRDYEQPAQQPEMFSIPR